MKKSQRGWISGAIVDMVVSGLVWVFMAGIAVGVFLSIGVPWLWQIVKPWIHSLTA